MHTKHKQRTTCSQRGKQRRANACARAHTRTDTGTHKPWLRDTRGLAPSLVFSPQSRLPPRLLVCVCLCDFVLCGPCACQHARILRRVYVSASQYTCMHARILRCTHEYCGACTCQYARMTARTERCHSRRVLFLAVTCPMDARAVTTTRVAAALSDKLAT